MNHDYSAVFKKLGIIRLEEYRKDAINFFENNMKYNIIITELASLNEEEVYNHLKGYSNDAKILCENEEQFEAAYRTFEQLKNIDGGMSTYFLIEPVTEYKILSEGYYFIDKLDSDEVDEIFNERDYKIYLMRVEQGKYLPETIREIHDSYNNGWIYDLRDIIENLSEFIDMSGVKFLAKLSK